jgi:hypothetical protein
VKDKDLPALHLKTSSYRSVNTLPLGYTRQSVNAAYGNNRWLFGEGLKIYKGTLWAERRIFEKYTLLKGRYRRDRSNGKKRKKT